MARLVIALLFLFVTACSDETNVQGAAEDSAQPAAETVAQPQAEAEAQPAADAGTTTEDKPLVNPQLRRLNERWTGDLDGMEERRLIRVLTVFGLPRYFLDGPEERGITYDVFKQFEASINERLDRDHVKVHLVFIPVRRDELISGLIEGRGDIAAAGLTITPERETLVDFTNPLTREVAEILVTGPSAPAIASVKDLAGREIGVRASSSYRGSLDALSQRFVDQGLAAITIRDMSEALEDEDILEMVSTGLLPWAVIDDYKAKAWTQVLDKLVIRDDIVFRTGGRIGYAFRKDSPQLKAALNEFAATHAEGTLAGNMLINEYLRDFEWSENALAEDDFQRFEKLRGIFEKYGDQYAIDFLFVVAQAYQESRLRQETRSAAGAVGVMQLLPSTAADPIVGIPDISDVESNIHAGVKYLNYLRSQNFDDPAVDRINQTLFTLASYNAGPARVKSLRKMAAEEGYNPNLWFDNVEIIAAREIGHETVQYVANILKYYVAYHMVINE
ncbi:MAG TPA: transporter substrate-binding domain-containing protein, partial [Pseudoxanthomonas sp.]|nr:transporter substrate-binding domain-containing protein [Pseudoxanthomonas sp.]